MSYTLFMFLAVHNNIAIFCVIIINICTSFVPVRKSRYNEKNGY